MSASKSNSADEETFAFLPKTDLVKEFSYKMRQNDGAPEKTYNVNKTGELGFEMKNVGRYLAKTVTFTIVSKNATEKKETILKPSASSVVQVRGKTALSTDQVGLLDSAKFFTSSFDNGKGTNSFTITVNAEHTVQFVVPVEMDSVVHLTAKLDWNHPTKWADMPLRCFFREDIQSILADAKAAVMQTVGKKHWTRFFAQYRITRMRSASEKMEKVIAEQKDALEKKDAEIEEKDAKIGKLESMLAESDKVIRSLQSEIKRLNELLRQRAIIDPNPGLRRKIEVLEEENKKKSEWIEKLEGALATAEKCIEEFKKKLADHEELKERIQYLLAKIGHLEGQNDRLEGQIESLLETRNMSDMDFQRKYTSP